LDYPAALEYLYSLTDYEKERIARYDPSTLDLSRVQRVLARLGEPHRHYPAVHIAGTKGKGSVAALCASALRAAGLRTGLYTSPHLHTFRERIQVDGELIPPDTLAALVQEYRPVFDQEPELTTFEAITALALTYFDQRQVDCAVIEVGLGGRLDATNVITPQVAVITSLSFDHTYLLGDTLAEIAYEKAGIIKPGVPTVCEPQPAEALAVIQRVCAERGSPLTLVGRDWTWQINGAGLDGQSFDLCHSQNVSSLDGPYTLPLLGRHQVTNAVTAIAALDLLRQEGGALHPQHIRQGVTNVRWPGRFEVLRREPPLVVDCAHNGDSAAKLVLALGDYFGPDQRWTFILGASSDKDVPAMLRALAPRADRLLATQSRHPRAMSPDQIVALAAEILPEVKVAKIGDVGSAMALALDGGDCLVCVTGSIFVVADAREAWALRAGSALPETDYQPPVRVSLTQAAQAALA
jgi:dihydrofolate synthase/folylpolyglutamate synthase